MEQTTEPIQSFDSSNKVRQSTVKFGSESNTFRLFLSHYVDVNSFMYQS